MNIAIVDDEQNEREELSTLVKEYFGLNRVPLSLSVFPEPSELLESYHSYAYAAIFMDVYMGTMNGVEAAKRILEADPGAIVIFLTSSSEHMGDAFHLHAFDYISKPADKESIFRVLDDVLHRQTRLSETPGLSFTSNGRDLCIVYDNLVSVSTSTHNYLEITDITGEVSNARLTLREVSDRLSEDPRFLMIIRGVIVNMDHIVRFENNSCIVKGGKSFGISIRKAKELESTWQNYRISRIRNEKREKRLRSPR